MRLARTRSGPARARMPRRLAQISAHKSKMEAPRRGPRVKLRFQREGHAIERSKTRCRWLWLLLASVLQPLAFVLDFFANRYKRACSDRAHRRTAAIHRINQQQAAPRRLRGLAPQELGQRDRASFGHSCARKRKSTALDNARMSAEALAATKWQDRREAWESITNAADAETLTTHLAKETNGAVLDAALDAVARVASPELAPALPYVVQKGLANARGATQRRGLRAVVAFQKVAPSETTDALVDGITTSRNARGPAACAKALTTECAPTKAWLSSNGDRLALAVAKLASAANGDARKAAVDLAVAVDDPAVFQKLPENAKKAVAKLRGSTPPPPPPPEAGPPPPPGSPPKRVTIQAPPRKAPSPEKGDDLLAALARRGVSPPYDAAFEGKWDARREKLEAVASVARACSGDGEALALAVAAACEVEPHAAVAKAAISACASVAGVAGVVGRRALVVALLPRLRDAKLASQASQALNDVSQIQPEVVFDDATVRAATDALAAGAKRRLPPQGRACGFRWASSAFTASSKAPPLSTKAWAALCAADCSDAHGPLRAAARDALSALCQRPRSDVKSALQMLDAKTRAKVLERQPKAPAPAASLQKRKPPPPKPQEVVVWPPSHITERTGTIAACDLAPTSLRATLRAPSEQRRAKALAELLKRAAGPGGGLDAREADADRVLRELRPLVGDARAALARAAAARSRAGRHPRARRRAAVAAVGIGGGGGGGAPEDPRRLFAQCRQRGGGAGVLGPGRHAPRADLRPRRRPAVRAHVGAAAVAAVSRRGDRPRARPHLPH